MGPGLGIPAGDFFVQVRSHFRYLLEEHGFVVMAEENPQWDVCKVILRSETFFVHVGQERGDVFFYIGPSASLSTRYLLGDVIAFLQRSTGEQAIAWFHPPKDDFSDSRSHISFQLNWYAEKLQPYCKRISELFQLDSFQQKQVELKEWEEIMDALRKETIHRVLYDT